MYTKIQNYVNFALRNDHSEDHQEKKEEIIANITDRYDELLAKTRDENYSYIEAIKMIGNFIQDENIEDSYKPQFAEMLLVSATILSVIGFIATLLSALVGLLVTGLSLSLYAVGALYLYQLSKFVKTEEYDVDKYTYFIDKAFSYMKTNFIFWALSLSLIISKLVHSIFLFIGVTNTLNNLSVADIMQIYTLSVIVFIILLIIIGALFASLYGKLMRKYSSLTGKTDVKSVGMLAGEFVGHEPNGNATIFYSKWFYPSFHGVIIALLIIDIFHIGNNTSSWVQHSTFFIIENIVLIIMYIVLTMLFITKKIKNHLIVPIFNIVVSILAFLIYLILGTSSASWNGSYFFFIFIVFVILFAVDYIFNRKSK